MSKKFRKVLAAILAGTMVLGSGVVANAAEGSKGEAKGTGGVDIVRDSDVFQVVLPTSAGTQFNYILNPTGVIAETNGAKYATSSTFANEGKEKMYFAHKNASGSVVSYATESELIKAWNKSNVDVQIEVKAKLNIATPSTATNSNIEIADASVAGDTSNDRKIYIALRASGSDVAITATESTTTATIASASDAYETKVVNKEYKKTLKASASNATTDAEREKWFSSYSFSLTGDCNATKEWSKLDVAPPEVTLTWKIDKPDGAVVVTDKKAIATVMTAGNDLILRLVAGQNADASKITSVKVNGETANYTVAASGAIIIAGKAAGGGSFNIEVVYDGKTYTAVTIATTMVSGNDLILRLVAGQNADASKITSVKVNGETASYTVAASGAITIAGKAANAGNYNVEVVYDGIAYTGSVTK